MLKWLFAIPPAVGSIWVSSDQVHNPFREDRNDLVVVNVRDGWVQVIDQWPNPSKLSYGIREFRFFHRRIKPAPCIC